MTEREALKMALEFIIASNQRSEFWLVPSSNLNKTVTAIREALAQPEPVIDKSAAVRIATSLGWTPQRTWVGLTQEDIDIAFDDTQEGGGFDDFAIAIEATLKRKNTS